MKQPYIYNFQIKELIQIKSEEIRRDYDGRVPILLGVLNGSFIFLADLCRELNMNCEVDFCRISSYSYNQQTHLSLTKEWELDFCDRDILIVEDIIDSGDTLRYLLEKIKEEGPNSIKICSLCYKEDSEIDIDYKFFKIEKDQYIYGYGMDDCNFDRNLKHIFIK